LEISFLLGMFSDNLLKCFFLCWSPSAGDAATQAK